MNLGDRLESQFPSLPEGVVWRGGVPHYSDHWD